jgi:signal transduction histidine kinase
MSHELRTPLNAIINFSKFVYNGVMGPITDEQKETLHEVIDSAEHLHNLINDVLDMSKIEAGSLKLFVEENVNISQILGSVISTGEALIREKPVRITAEIAPDLPTVRGDRQRILQIMLNIMSNACKFTDEGDITLKARHHNGMIEMSIQDTGSGIAQEDYAMVFEAFKQTETGLRQGGGTGLGLPISRSLVEAHGGKIWFESKAGYGTTFFVNLPVKSSLLTPTLSSNGASAKAGVTIA